MRRVAVMTVSITLSACAANRTDSLHVSPDAEPSSTAAPTQSAEDLDVMKVVELRPTPKELAPDEPACRKERTLGTRIIREVCTQTLTEAEDRMQDEITRAELDYARQMAMIQEQERLRRMAEEEMRRRQMLDQMRPSR